LRISIGAVDCFDPAPLCIQSRFTPLAESLRATIASAPFSTEQGELSVTVSIGISHSPSDIRRELKEVLTEADAALYTAKDTGRNRVVCFDNGNA
jgi:diguanylate cyclase (GGDEF)-like protein